MNKKIIKVCIFDKNSTPSQVIKGNGDAILDNICIKCETEEDLKTGEYYLDCIFLVDDNGLYKSVHDEAILKVQMDYGNEYFRIASIKETPRDFEVFARQITISETLDMWLEDVRPENKNGQGALSHIIDSSKGKKDIRVFSDIQTTSTAYYMNMSVYKALHDCDQSFSNRWGGEIQRRGYDLTINKKIGMHRGVQIRSRKNLTGFEANTNIDTVVTRIKPVGFNGITINGYVDSPLINKYSSIKTKEIKYNDVKVKDPEREDDEGFNTLEEAQSELTRRSKLEFTQNHMDEIKADYRVNFIQLEQTEEYKNYVQAERVYLGDEIDVYEAKLDINITVRAVKRKFDILKQRVIEIELSNGVESKNPPTISDIVNGIDKIENEINENNKWYQDAINNATDLIENGLKDSYVVVRKNEILIMDTTDINTATNVWRFNRGGLAHSKTGYYGTYDTAITMDGSIVGKFITGLIVNGEQINAKNLMVTRNDGTKTFEINSSGDVSINATKFTLLNKSIDTIAKEEATLEGNKAKQYADAQLSILEGTINLRINGLDGKYTELKQTVDGIDLTGKVSFNDLANINSKTVIHGGNIKTDTLGVDTLKSNNENPIIKLFGNCAIDATKQYNQGQGNAIRVKWDDYNYTYMSENNFSVNLNGLWAFRVRGDFSNGMGILEGTDDGHISLRMANGYGGSLSHRLKFLSSGTGIQIRNEYDNGYGDLNAYTLRCNTLVESSDVKLKTNIKQIVSSKYRDKEFNSFTKEHSDITQEDMFDFVKSINIYSYNYKERPEDKVTLGLIANELLDYKIGDLLISNDKETGDLGVNLYSYISVLLGSLKEEIRKREKLENKIKSLEDRLLKLENIILKQC